MNEPNPPEEGAFHHGGRPPVVPGRPIPLEPLPDDGRRSSRPPAREPRKSGKGLLIAILVAVPFVLIGVVILLVVLLRPRVAPEVEWSRNLADQYLEALSNGRFDVMRSLGTPEHAMTVRDMRDWAGPATYKIESHTVSPSGEQVIFKGRAEFREFPGGTSFTLMLEKDGGRWKVAACTHGPIRDLGPIPARFRTKTPEWSTPWSVPWTPTWTPSPTWTPAPTRPPDDFKKTT